MYSFTIPMIFLWLNCSSDRDALHDTDSVELRRSMQRDAQRARRNAQDDEERENARRKNTIEHREARQNAVAQPQKEKWWDFVAKLNSSNAKIPMRLQWNRSCKHCGVKVSLEALFLLKPFSLLHYFYRLLRESEYMISVSSVALKALIFCPDFRPILMNGKHFLITEMWPRFHVNSIPCLH